MPGRVLVKFRDGGTSSARSAMARMAGASNITRPSYADFEIMTIDASANPETVAARLATEPEVEIAQADYRVYPYFRPNDPLYGQQWNLPLIGLESAWDINGGATASVVVAVLDTGVAFRNGIGQFNARAFRARIPRSATSP